MNKLIGVFDSGVGGLSVLKALLKDHPEESFIYLGDTARLPYGVKSKETIKSYVERNVNYLKKNYDLKSIVVACNSASSVLKEMAFDIPTLGVIEAGAESALKLSKNNKIGLWATQATVQSNEYETVLKKLNSQAEVTSVSCPTLVALVEEGFSEHPLLPQAFDYYLNKLPKDVDTLVLGCTHFPFFKEKLQEHLKKQGRKLELADASTEISTKLKASASPQKAQKNIKILLTDITPHFESFVDKTMPQGWSFSIETINL